MSRGRFASRLLQDRSRWTIQQVAQIVLAQGGLWESRLVGNREDIRVVVIEEDAVEGLASCVGGDEAERQPNG